MKAEIKAELQAYLQGLLKILGDSAEIQITRETDREIFINLQGFSALDGSDPKPLRSLSYLTEICIRRKSGKGIKVYLDDFGTGVSSLSHLGEFPIPALKVDGTFIQEVATRKETISIVRAILGMAHSLNMEVVAEGVENEDQYELLKAEGCDLVQGYYCGAPMPPDHIASFLKNFDTTSIGHEADI